jgi:excisionase family DNA binding protein
VHRRYLSITEVQRELGLSVDQVQQLIDSRRLSAFRILGMWRIEREMLDQMVNDLYEEENAARGPVISGSHAGQCAQAGPPADTSPGPGMPETAARTAAPCAPRHLSGTIEELTGQQQRILELVGQGLSNAEIAASLNVEISTVKSHVSRLLQRFALRDREQLIVLAWRTGLMSGEQASASDGTAGACEA